jgi:phospholipid/cholesterol/gamma-HCH transport system ATP-binding protein
MPVAFFKKKSAPPAPMRGDDDARPVVELTDVGLSFGEKEILKGITFQVLPKERFVVMGKSGGGKSTLLRLILGILQPTKGSVQFNGVEVTRMGRHRLNRMRQKIGMVYQYSALISSLTVRGNLALPLEELTEK